MPGSRSCRRCNRSSIVTCVSLTCQRQCFSSGRTTGDRRGIQTYRLITLNEDFRLAREWFVITHSKSLSCALVAFDETGREALPEQIRYWALKTSNPAIVGSLANAVEGVIDWSLAA